MGPWQYWRRQFCHALWPQTALGGGFGWAQSPQKEIWGSSSGHIGMQGAGEYDPISQAKDKYPLKRTRSWKRFFAPAPQHKMPIMSVHPFKSQETAKPRTSEPFDRFGSTSTSTSNTPWMVGLIAFKLFVLPWVYLNPWWWQVAAGPISIGRSRKKSP
jgi:hypothetical protein